MIQYTIRRLLATIPVLLLTSVIVFLLMRLLPSDPIELLVERAFTEVPDEVIEKLRAKHGLDRPLYTQYFIWLGNLLARDYSTIQAVVLFITFAVVVADLVVDLAYGWLDPRIHRS